MEKEIVIAKDKEHLRFLIDTKLRMYGNNCDLNNIDVSQVTDMSFVFYCSAFNGDISKWDVSNVKSMRNMFNESKFNGDLSQWDVSNVNDMTEIFHVSMFNGDISGWNVQKLEYLSFAFHMSSFTQDVSLWKPFCLEKKGSMFKNCSAPVPYWLHYENKEERNVAINLYHEKLKLMDYLNSDLNSKNNSIKVKI